MMHLSSGPARLAIALAAGGVSGASSARAEGASEVAGAWRGESVCASKAETCHDEHVVYYIKEVANRPDAVFIQADKIVDGRAVTMGAAEWRYDRARATLEWRTDRQTWSLKMIGNRLEGTLTLADGTVFRNVKLDKDK
jgi:hypothetical protein